MKIPIINNITNLNMKLNIDTEALEAAGATIREVTVDGTAVRLFIPKGGSTKLVIMPPGMGATKEQSGKNVAIPVYLENGRACLHYDLYGHGASEGEFIDMTVSKLVGQLETILDYVAGEGYDDVTLYGSSSPAIASVACAANPRFTNLKKLVLIAPILDVLAYLNKCRGPHAVEDWKNQGYFIHVGSMGEGKWGYGYYEDYVANHADYASMLRAITCPTLWISGDQDENVDIEVTRRDVALISNCKYVEIPGGSHLFIKSDGTRTDLSPIVYPFVNGDVE